MVQIVGPPETWLQNGPVSGNGLWRVELPEGYGIDHQGRWELNGGALALINKDGRVRSAYGPGAWLKVLLIDRDD